MFVKGRSIIPFHAPCWLGIGLIAAGGAAGCASHGACCGPGVPPSASIPPEVRPRASVPLPASPDSVIVDSPRADDDFAVASPASAIETWIVHTRACEQEMGSNPWPSIAIARLDEQGGPLHGSEPEALLVRMAGRPSVILIHGAEYTYRESIREAIQVRTQLEAIGGLTPETLFVVFDWPSERTLPLLSVDLNEKARRSRVAGYHLARFLQASPANSAICLMGQSDGGRVALAAMHLLSGAELRRFFNEPAGQLTSGRGDLRLRGVVLAAAVGHTWLNPGDRLGSALPTSEALLNLRNSGDYALAVFGLGAYTGLHPALGMVGLNSHDLKKLGPLKDRVEEINHHSLSGHGHTLFTRALTYPVVARRIAAYTSWGDVSDGAGKRYSTGDLR